MRFRRDKQAAQEWNRFLQAYEEPLSSLGILESTLQSEEDWNFFINHGYDFSAPKLLNLDHWSRAQLEELLEILEAIYADGFFAGSQSGVLSWLRVQLAENAEHGAAGKGSIFEG